MQVHFPMQQVYEFVAHIEELEPTGMARFVLHQHIHVALRGEVVADHGTEQRHAPHAVPTADLSDRFVGYFDTCRHFVFAAPARSVVPHEHPDHVALGVAEVGEPAYAGDLRARRYYFASGVGHLLDVGIEVVNPDDDERVATV